MAQRSLDGAPIVSDLYLTSVTCNSSTISMHVCLTVKYQNLRIDAHSHFIEGSSHGEGVCRSVRTIKDHLPPIFYHLHTIHYLNTIAPSHSTYNTTHTYRYV
jgi:hypothetical protein